MTELCMDVNVTVRAGTEEKSKSNKKNKSNRTNKNDKNANDVIISNTASKETKIKPIIKNGTLTNDTDDSPDNFVENVYKSHRKKRNKSVSFLIDDEEQTPKKSKSNSAKSKSTLGETEDSSENILNKHKQKKDKNKIKDTANDTQEKDLKKRKEKWNKKIKKQEVEKSVEEVPETLSIQEPVESAVTEPTDEIRKKKDKKRKKQNSLSETIDIEEVKGSNERIKKVHPKAEGDGIPKKKSKKASLQPEAIANDLETLKIGDNPHSLTNLLDEMTVSDKNKKKKDKKDLKKNNKTKENLDTDPSNEEIAKKEEKLKSKWKKRKWNKGRPVTVDDSWLQTAVVVENIPLTEMLNYKELLTEKFADIGTIKNIGIAETYPTVVSKPVFTTTVQFNDEEAATKALEEDNSLLKNSRIRVVRPQSPLVTTVVVRSYGELNDQNISSIFNEVGKIRSIRIMDKNRKKMATAFVEFDGPDAQQKALEIKEAKIGSKKIHISRFEHRVKLNDQKPTSDTNNEIENNQ